MQVNAVQRANELMGQFEGMLFMLVLIGVATVLGWLITIAMT
jgi:hypothetical protein